MNVVSHSIANIFKRLLVVLLLFTSGQRQASGANFVGFTVASLGLGIYLHGKVAGTTSPAAKRQADGLITVGPRRSLFFGFGMLFMVIVTALASMGGGSNLIFITALPSLMTSRYQLILPPSRSLPANITGPDYSLVNPFPPMSDIKIAENSPEMIDFLKWNLREHPTSTDFRARTLRTNKEIVDETQRILMNLLKDILGKARHVMLVEIAIYENKGDPAITVGEVMLLRRMNITIVYYCNTYICAKKEYLEKAKSINKKYPKDELVILLQGGGNLVGYGFVDDVRNVYIKEFPDRKIVLFSQSIWLTPSNARHLIHCQKMYSNHSNLVMFLRDRQSLQIAQENFKGTELILAPDMAFGMGMVPRKSSPMYDIVWLRRGDTESSKYEMPKMPANISIVVEDWWKYGNKTTGKSQMEKSFQIALKGFSFLERGRIVVTDRLHGHILSTLLNIPHVLIDNPPYLKLSSFDKSWTTSLENTVIISNGTFALQEALIMLEKYNSTLPVISQKKKQTSKT